MGHTITILLSGQGSNARTLIHACASPALPGTSVVRVIYNRKAAESGVGIAAAREAGIPTTYHNLLAYEKEDEIRYRQAQSIAVEVGLSEVQKQEVKTRARLRYDEALASLVLEDTPRFVFLLGFMMVVSPCFLDPLKKARIPVINLHPALPGMYSGMNAIERQYDDFKAGKLSCAGIMVHEVIEEVDLGQALCTRKVPIYEYDTLSEFEKRLHEHEWELIVEGAREAIKRLPESQSKRNG